MLDADLICHVRDISHPESEAQARDVETILEALGVGPDVPRIEMWNKADALEPEAMDAAATLAGRQDDVYLGSALTGQGLDALLDRIAGELTSTLREEERVLPFAAGKARAWLHDEGAVLDETQEKDGTHLNLRWTERQAARFASIFPELSPDAPPPQDTPERTPGGWTP